MKYWIRINHSARGPYTEAEILAQFGPSLPSNTPCAVVGVNKWGTLGELLPTLGSGEPDEEINRERELSPTEAWVVETVTRKAMFYGLCIVLLFVMLPFLIIIQCTQYKTSGMIGLCLAVAGVFLLPWRFDNIAKANPDFNWVQVMGRTVWLVQLLALLGFASSSPKAKYRNPFTSDSEK